MAKKKSIKQRIRLMRLPEELASVLEVGAAHAGVSEETALAVVVGLSFAVLEQQHHKP